jgi:glycosidase
MIDQMVWWVTNTEIDGFRIDAPDFVPFDFWAQAIPAVRASTERPLLMFAEGARNDHYDAGFDLTFGWRFFYGLRARVHRRWGAAAIARAHGEEYAPVPPGKRVLRWTTNHDETAYDAPPPVLFGSLDASLAAYASMVAYGGTPLIYSGQEVGVHDLTQIVLPRPDRLDDEPGRLPRGTRGSSASASNTLRLRTGSITDRSTGTR